MKKKILPITPQSPPSPEGFLSHAISYRAIGLESSIAADSLKLTEIAEIRRGVLNFAPISHIYLLPPTSLILARMRRNMPNFNKNIFRVYFTARQYFCEIGPFL